MIMHKISIHSFHHPYQFKRLLVKYYAWRQQGSYSLYDFWCCYNDLINFGKSLFMNTACPHLLWISYISSQLCMNNDSNSTFHRLSIVEYPSDLCLATILPPKCWTIFFKYWVKYIYDCPSPSLCVFLWDLLKLLGFYIHPLWWLCNTLP